MVVRSFDFEVDLVFFETNSKLSCVCAGFYDFFRPNNDCSNILFVLKYGTWSLRCTKISFKANLMIILKQHHIHTNKSLAIHNKRVRRSVKGRILIYNLLYYLKARNNIHRRFLSFYCSHRNACRIDKFIMRTSFAIKTFI